MIEDRHIELIHAELDGELTSEQRAELSRVLLANPEARALRDELNRLFGALAKVEERGRRRPDDIGPAVLTRLPRPVGAGAGRPGAPGGTPGVLRYAAVFVGGLLASAAPVQLGMRGRRTGLDVSQLVGTIGGQRCCGRQAPDRPDRARAGPGQRRGQLLSGRVGSSSSSSTCEAREPVEVVATQGGQTVQFSLGTRPDAAPERLHLAAGRRWHAGVADRTQGVRRRAGSCTEGALEAPGRVIGAGSLGAEGGRTNF